MFARNAPIARLVVVSVLVPAAILSLLLATLDYWSDSSDQLTRLHASASIQTEQLTADVSDSAPTFDPPMLARIAARALHAREAVAVIIRPQDASAPQSFHTFGLIRDGTAFRQVDSDAPAPAADFAETRPLVVAGKTVGTVKIAFTSQPLRADLREEFFIHILVSMLFGVMLAAGLYFLMWRIILRPLLRLQEYAAGVSAGTPTRPARGVFRGELDHLRLSIEKMVQLLESRYQTLRQNQAMLALVAHISSDLVSATPENLNEKLTRALADIAPLLNADRIVLGATEEATGQLIARAHYRRTEPSFPDRLVISERYPALWAELRRGRTHLVRDVALLGPESAIDQGHYQEVDIRSQISVPVLVDGRLQYVLAVAAVGRLAKWSDEAIARVRMLADVLATAAMRCDAAQARLTSAHQFRTFIEQAPVPVILTPSPDGGPLYFNPAFTRTFGYTLEDMPTVEIYWELIYPDPALRASRRAAWLQNIDLIQRTGGFHDGGEVEMRTKSGEVRYCQHRLSVIDGFRLGFISDLTQRRRTEATLRLTQFCVDHNPIMIFRIDLTGRFVYANDAACRQFGYAPVEMERLHVWDLSTFTTAAQWSERLEFFRLEKFVTRESWYVRRDGSRFPAQVHIQFVNFDGEDLFFVFAFDIARRQALQDAEHAYTRRIQMLATELTRAEERQRRELAAVLHDSVGQNLFAATTQLLAARARAGDLAPEIEKAMDLLDQVTRDARQLTFELCPPVLYQLGLSPALQRLTDQFSARHGITCSLTGDSAGPADLNARGLAYQAVRELLNNVAKHASARQVTISATEHQDMLAIEVADDGIGFDASPLPPTPGGPGGFGLFHLRERLELLGGNLQVFSSPQQGTRVQFSLPLTQMSAGSVDSR